MNIDLHGAREKANLSQSKLAAMLNLSAAQVSCYEQDPGTVTAELLGRWAQALGTDIANLIASATSPPPLVDAGNPYLQLHQNLSLLEKYTADFYPSEELDIPTKPPTAGDVRKQIHRYRQKPNLVLVGRFDSGKSRLANALMGSKVLPSQLQPATRVITFVRHSCDRPTWFQDQVGILAEDFWARDEKGNQVFDLTLLDSQSWVEKHCIKAGSLDVLREHGVHNHLSETEIEGHSAIVYVDSPLLKSCNIVDFPGYSDRAEQTSEDVKKASSAVQIADLVLYTSPIPGFMNAEDFSRLSYLLRVLPSPETYNPDFPILGNLFIVGTHAHPGISGLEVSSALQVGSVRLCKHLSETVLEERSKLINRAINLEHLQRCFFAFWEESPDRWRKLREELVLILGQSLPKARINKIDNAINLLKHEVAQEIVKQMQGYKQTVSEVQTTSEAVQRQLELGKFKKKEPQRLDEMEKGRRQIHQRILELRDRTRNSFRQAYTSAVQVSAVETMIRDRYENSKKEAKDCASSYLVEQLQSALETCIEENSEVLKADINEFLGAYEEVLLKSPKLNIGSVFIPFDAKGAFLGGLAGVGGVGAFAFWAASLGNLGAYILVAQFVSLLSVLGISISGGVATAVAFVAAIGGPITLAIGLFAAAAASIWALFGESWERRLAKKIVSHFEKEQVLDKFFKGSDEYWQDTAKAFDRGANTTEEKFQEHIQHVQEISRNDEASRKKIENIVSLLKKLKDFFAGIPWEESV